MTLYKVSARIEREDGFVQDSFTHHDEAIVKDEKAFMIAFYNNTVQLWKELELPTTREIELQNELNSKMKMSTIAWTSLMLVLFGAIIGLLILVNT